MADYKEDFDDDLSGIPEVPHNAKLKILSRDDTGHDLSVEEALFVRSFIIDRNEVAALRRLDYAGSATHLRSIAKRYLANPEVEGAIDMLAKRMMEKLEITAEKVTRQLASMAFFDPRSIISFNGTMIGYLPIELWPDEAVAAIAGMKQTEKGAIEIKFVDKLRATEVLGKQLNLLQDPDETEKKSAAEAAATAALDKMADVFSRIADKRAEAPTSETEEQRTLN